MKITIKNAALLLALAFSISLVSCKEGTKEKVQDAGEAVMEDTKEATQKAGDAVEEAAEKAGDAVKDAARDVEDALVDGTDYHATGMIPCKMEGQPSGNCDFGVRRIGNGTADVVITRPDGNTVTVHFEMGKVKSVEESQGGFRPEFEASKEGDMHILTNGEDRYEIPDAVIVGG